MKKLNIIWCQFKDFLLLLILLNSLIGMLENFDKADVGESVRELNRKEIPVIQVVGSETKVSTPEKENKPAKVDDVLADILQGEFSAYSVGDGFTPSDIAASGKKVAEGMIACPSKYKFGTKIKVNGSIYTCEDRMKNDGGFDIYFSDYSQAIKFGRRQLKYEVL